jgi:hypothetical protein
VGYGAINGALANGGFFDPSSKKGIWLAGDYNQAPVVLINSVNDGQVKQVTNTFETARWMTALHDDKLIKNTVTGGLPSDNAKDEMLSLMASAVSGHAPSIMKGDLPSPAPFDVLHCKIGVGTLKEDGVKPSSCNHDSAGHTHRCVTAEIAIVQQKATPQRKFVVCWQGVVDTDNRADADIKRINQIIANVMDKYKP